MVLYVLQYDILPGKEQAYAEWVKPAIARLLAVPGVVELRGFRPVTGPYGVVSSWEFADLAAWAAWRANEQVGKVFDEARGLTTNLRVELWGPSPVAPEPIRPQG